MGLLHLCMQINVLVNYILIKKKRQKGDCPVEYYYLPDYKIPSWVWKKVFSQNKKTKMSEKIEEKWWRSYEKRLK